MSDVFDDPLGALERTVQARTQQQREHEAVRSEKRQLAEAWQKVKSEPGSRSLLQLGKLLKAQDAEFWLLLWRQIIQRGIESGGWEIDRVQQRAATIQILEAACRGDELTLDQLVVRALQPSHPFNWAEAFGDAEYFLDMWQDPSQLPETPHMRRLEFVEAVKDMDGMSNPSITRMLQDHRLKMVKPANAHYRFRHSDPSVHRAILSCVVTYFSQRNSPNSPGP